MTNAGVQASHALTITDINTAHGEEPRIRDTRIGARLGMARPTNIRKLIDDNREELERYGLVHAVRAPIRSGKGRISETTAYYLNEPQTLLLCMFSRTSAAADVRQEVIGVYMEYRRGQSAPAVPEPVQGIPPYCTGCAYHETNAFIALCNTLPGRAGNPLPLTAPPTKREMGIISDRRRDHEELRRGIRQEIAGFLVLDGVAPPPAGR